MRSVIACCHWVWAHHDTVSVRIDGSIAAMLKSLSSTNAWKHLKMRLSQRIRQLRRKSNLSQQALAEMVGVQRSAVSNWESAGPVQPAMANLIAIATIMNVSVEWLATGRGPMQLGHDAHLDILAVEGELVDAPLERELLKIFRTMSNRSQRLLFELADELSTARRARPHASARQDAGSADALVPV